MGLAWNSWQPTSWQASAGDWADWWNERAGPRFQIGGRRQQPESTAARTPRESTGTTDKFDWSEGWWNREGADFASAPGDLTVPEWWSDDFSTPQEMYETLSTLPRGMREWVDLERRSTWRANQQQEAAQARQRELLAGISEGAQRAYDEWAADPNREYVLQQFRERSQPGYSIVSPVEQTALHNRIAQNYAQNLNAAQASAAARGVGAGGAAIGQEAAIRSMAQTGGLTLDAAIAEANRQQQLSALDALGRLTGAYEGTDLAYLSALDQIAAQQAAVEGSIEYQPTDYLAFAELADAQRRAEEEQRFRDEMFAELQDQTKYNWQDFVNWLLSLPGSQIPQMFF